MTPRVNARRSPIHEDSAVLVRVRYQLLTFYGRYLYLQMRPTVNDELDERIENAIDRYGYSSKTEFVNDAIRRRLEDLDL